MTTYELMLKVKEILDENGFETSSAPIANLRDFEHQGHATKDGKSWYQIETKYNLSRLYGYKITFEVVFRHNATEENKSVDVSIYKWESSSGRRVAKERVNVNMGDKAIANRVKKIIDQYEAL